VDALGDLDFGVGYENHTSYPAPGHIILYPGGISETEILLAYSGVHFAQQDGAARRQSFHHPDLQSRKLPEMGKTVLWKGAQRVRTRSVMADRYPRDLRGYGRNPPNRAGPAMRGSRCSSCQFRGGW